MFVLNQLRKENNMNESDFKPRDTFACFALAGLLSNASTASKSYTANKAYRIADAMIEAREETKETKETEDK